MQDLNVSGSLLSGRYYVIIVASRADHGVFLRGQLTLSLDFYVLPVSELVIEYLFVAGRRHHGLNDLIKE